MCGLVGVYGQIYHKEKTAFQILHHLDVLRGRDGAGLYYHTFDGQGEVLKVDSIPDDLVYYYDKTKFNKDMEINVHSLNLLLGHNRKATMGKVNQENAHPFELSNIVGAHNGVLKNQSLTKLPHYNKDDIDSLSLFKAINDLGQPKVNKNFNKMQKIVSQVEGAMALTWYNKSLNQLNIYRNNQRPLFWVLSKDSKTLFWASEEWMLAVALKKSGIECQEIKPFPVNNWFSIESRKKNNTVQPINFKGQCELEPKVVQTQNYSYGYGQQLNYNVQQRGNVTVYTPSKNQNTKDKEPRSFFLNNKRYSRTEFDNYLVKLGCCLCSSTIYFADRLVTKWFDLETPICESCVNEIKTNKDELFLNLDKTMSGTDVH